MSSLLQKQNLTSEQLQLLASEMSKRKKIKRCCLVALVFHRRYWGTSFLSWKIRDWRTDVIDAGPIGNLVLD